MWVIPAGIPAYALCSVFLTIDADQGFLTRLDLARPKENLQTAQVR